MDPQVLETPIWSLVVCSDAPGADEVGQLWRLRRLAIGAFWEYYVDLLSLNMQVGASKDYHPYGSRIFLPMTTSTIIFVASCYKALYICDICRNSR